MRPAALDDLTLADPIDAADDFCHAHPERVAHEQVGNDAEEFSARDIRHRACSVGSLASLPGETREQLIISVRISP
jgi:hypothetical protein